MNIGKEIHGPWNLQSGPVPGAQYQGDCQGTGIKRGLTRQCASVGSNRFMLYNLAGRWNRRNGLNGSSAPVAADDPRGPIADSTMRSPAKATADAGRDTKGRGRAHFRHRAVPPGPLSEQCDRSFLNKKHTVRRLAPADHSTPLGMPLRTEEADKGVEFASAVLRHRCGWRNDEIFLEHAMPVVFAAGRHQPPDSLNRRRRASSKQGQQQP